MKKRTWPLFCMTIAALISSYSAAETIKKIGLFDEEDSFATDARSCCFLGDGRQLLVAHLASVSVYDIEKQKMDLEQREVVLRKSREEFAKLKNDEKEGRFSKGAVVTSGRTDLPEGTVVKLSLYRVKGGRRNYMAQRNTRVRDGGFHHRFPLARGVEAPFEVVATVWSRQSRTVFDKFYEGLTAVAEISEAKE